MKIFKHIACLAVIVFLFASCSNKNKNLLKVIPADAAGVVSIDMPKIIEKGGMIDDDKIVIPNELKKVVESNEKSSLCQLINDLPYLGIDPECKAYSFMTTKTFGKVLLFALDDDKEARKTIEKRTGKDFHEVNDISCISQADDFYAIHDEMLFIGTVNVSQEESKLAAAAAKMLKHDVASIIDNEEVMKCLDEENDINAYIELKGLKNMCKRSKMYREMSQKMPLVDIFIESDIKAYVASLNFGDKEAEFDVKIKVDNNSDYINLLNRTLATTESDFLKVIPESMDYVFAMSVKGENFVKLPQINKMIATLKKTPKLGRLDVESMFASIDGPVAVGMAKDPNLDDWSTVFAAKSKDPDEVLNTITSFATTMGQSPEMYNDEYIYEYENKMVSLGVKEGVVYMKLLTYDQIEKSFYDHKNVRDFYSKSPMGIYVRANNPQQGGELSLGLTNKTNIKGVFTPSVKGAKTVIAFLQMLCDIKPSPEDEEIDAIGLELKNVSQYN